MNRTTPTGVGCSGYGPEGPSRIADLDCRRVARAYRPCHSRRFDLEWTWAPVVRHNFVLTCMKRVAASFHRLTALSFGSTTCDAVRPVSLSSAAKISFNTCLSRKPAIVIILDFFLCLPQVLLQKSKSAIFDGCNPLKYQGTILDKGVKNQFLQQYPYGRETAKSPHRRA
jgi:hypothetical protein